MSNDDPTVDAPSPGLQAERMLLGEGAPKPDRVGRYRIKRLIATGGMGSVYEAVQERPRRVVALKLMRSGIASRSALRRFEYESQLLARLRHPHIAEVYEAGTHDAGDGGVPYFAMEYIHGAKRITDYARGKKLDAPQRLTLFLDACRAVHHGHTKGIIHRDLKPDNLLVDSHGQVKIIDFGVARATDSDLAVTTLQTDIGALVGTLQYISPEQVEADPHDLDTRSDVYSLGVVLYELLSDKLPYDASSVKVFEATRLIREQQAPPLSTVDRRLGGDVETIVLTALEKDRERRYQSAENVAADIERYLNDEPITARPPSLGYQVRVFSRRHKAVLGGVAAVFAVLLAAAIVSSALWVRAEGARAEAVEATRQAERARVQAEANEARALTEAERAMAVVGLFQEMFAAVDPHEGNPPDMTVRELLDEFTMRFGGQLDQQPEIEATIRASLGEAYRTLGVLNYAEHHLDRALTLRRQTGPPDDPDLAHVLYHYSWVHHDRRDYYEAERMVRMALAIRRRALGDDDPSITPTLAALGDYLHHQGRYDEAYEMFQEELRRDPDHLTALQNVGSFFGQTGRWDLAGEHYQRALELAPDTAWLWFRVGVLHAAEGETEEYRHHVAEALNRFADTDHPQTADITAKLALLLPGGTDDLAVPVRLAEQARVEWEGHQYEGWVQMVYGLAMYRTGRFSEAVEWLDRARQQPPHAACAVAAGVLLAMSHHQLGDPEEARRHLAWAEQRMRPSPRDGGDPLAGYWHDWLICYMLHDEAAALLAGGGAE